MIPENMDEIVMLAKKVKSLHVDNFIAKSFGFVEQSKSTVKKQITEEFFKRNQQFLYDELQKLNDESFNAVYRSNRIMNEVMDRTYGECYAGGFHAYLGADGGVWQCCNLQGLSAFSFGNLYKQSFLDIWQGHKRQQVLEILKQSGLLQCPRACKLDVMNRYLAELVHPGNHVNFI